MGRQNGSSGQSDPAGRPDTERRPATRRIVDTRRPVDTRRRFGDRRRFLRTVTAATLIGSVGVAGCLGGAPQNEGEGEELPEGVSERQFREGPVPEVYRTATSIGGERRDPNQLVAKSVVNFGEAEDVAEAPEGETCANCHEFITDKNGDGFGACVRVEGYIGGEDWCSLWHPLSGEGHDDEGDDDTHEEGGESDDTDTPTY